MFILKYLGHVIYDDQNPFEYHAPTPEQTQAIIKVRDACKVLYDILLQEVPASAEQTIAVRKLEECSMWANKAIVFY